MVNEPVFPSSILASMTPASRDESGEEEEFVGSRASLRSHESAMRQSSTFREFLDVVSVFVCLFVFVLPAYWSWR